MKIIKDIGERVLVTAIFFGLFYFFHWLNGFEYAVLLALALIIAKQHMK